MAFTFTHWGIFGLVYIIILGIVSNSGQTAINSINNQFAKIQCPTPLYNMVDFLNGTIINSEVNPATGKNFGTTYQCFYDNTSVPPSTHISASFVAYNATVANFPSGWFNFLGDTFGAYMYKVGALGNLLLYILTPINFNIMGITLSSLSGIPLMFVVLGYVLSYLGIGFMTYKALDPFGGGS